MLMMIKRKTDNFYVRERNDRGELFVYSYFVPKYVMRIMNTLY